VIGSPAVSRGTVAGVQKMFSVGAILSSPVVVNRTIYVGSADGNLYAID
jgi:outer membrane protein assembly factor BamB